MSQTLRVPIDRSAYCAKRVICILGAELPRTRFEIDSIRIVSGGRRLVRDIRAGLVVLSDPEVTELTQRAVR